MDAAFAYDNVQRNLSESDDTLIRSRIANFSDALWKNQADHDGGGIDSVDYHFKCYPAIAVAGYALSDYNKTTPYGSTPANWTHMVVDFLQNDSRHPSWNRPMISWDVDPAGVSMANGVSGLLLRTHNQHVSGILTYKQP